MENRDYNLEHVRRLLAFPLRVSSVAVRPRNAITLRRTCIEYLFISFIFKYENKTVISDGRKLHARARTPYLEIARPGNYMDMLVPAVRDELFFRFDANSAAAEKLFNLQDCVFEMTPRFQELREAVYHALDAPHCPGMADRIDFLALEMAREAMLNRRDDEREKGGTGEADERIFKVANWIDLHYDEPLDLDGLIRRSGLERRTFYREWNKFYAESPKRTMMRLRFEKAREMLRSLRKPIGEIAGECGFPDAMYFCRAFKLRYGITPGDYHRAVRDGNAKTEI